MKDTFKKMYRFSVSNCALKTVFFEDLTGFENLLGLRNPRIFEFRLHPPAAASFQPSELNHTE